MAHMLFEDIWNRVTYLQRVRPNLIVTKHSSVLASEVREAHSGGPPTPGQQCRKGPLTTRVKNRMHAGIWSHQNSRHSLGQQQQQQQQSSPDTTPSITQVCAVQLSGTLMYSHTQ